MSVEKAVGAIEPFLGGRAARLLEKHEPELCEGIRAAVAAGAAGAAGATAGEVKAAVLRTVGRRDTALMAFYYAETLAAVGPSVEKS